MSTILKTVNELAAISRLEHYKVRNALERAALAPAQTHGSVKLYELTAAVAAIAASYKADGTRAYAVTFKRKPTPKLAPAPLPPIPVEVTTPQAALERRIAQLEMKVDGLLRATAVRSAMPHDLLARTIRGAAAQLNAH